MMDICPVGGVNDRKYLLLWFHSWLEFKCALLKECDKYHVIYSNFNFSHFKYSIRSEKCR